MKPRNAEGTAEAAAAGEGLYRSCHWIEGGLLVGEQVKICCVGNLMNHATAALRTLANLGEGQIPLQRVFEVKHELRIANQGPQAPCEGCHLLKEQPWAANRAGFDFLALGGYMHCNLACSFCVSSKYKPGERLPGSLLAVIDQLIEAGALRAPARIDLGGASQPSTTSLSRSSGGASPTGSPRWSSPTPRFTWKSSPRASTGGCSRS